MFLAVAMNEYKLLKEKEFEVYVSEWFRQAKLRYTIEEAKSRHS